VKARIAAEAATLSGFADQSDATNRVLALESNGLHI
jgi:hypothetical protein